MPTWLTPTSPDHGLDEPVEMHLGQSDSFSDDAFETTVQLKCRWDQKIAVMNNMLIGPSEWPYLPGQGIYASRASSVPFPGETGTRSGAANQFYTYDFALVTVAFEPLSISGGENPTFFSESIEPSAEFITIPHTKFVWGTGIGTDLKPEEAPGKVLIGFDYVVTLFNVVSVPSWVLTLVGCCNSAAVTSPSLGFTFPLQTLLFNPPKISRTVALGGSNRYQISTRYTYRRDGWNKFWRAESNPPAFESMYHKDLPGDVIYLNYPTADFSGAIP